MTLENSEDTKKIIEQLSPLERSVIPYLNLSYDKIKEKTSLDDTSLLRALRFLEAKGILKLELKEETIVELGTNGIYYKKNNLPERVLLTLFENKNLIPLEEAKKEVKLSENEFSAALGALKNKAMIELSKGKLILNASKEEITKKFLEEQLLEILPTPLEKLPPEMKYAYENLKKRKDIVFLKKVSQPSFTLTDLGKSIAGKTIEVELLEEVTPELIKNGTKGKKFRKYDLSIPTPRIYGGRMHFVNEAINEARKIWLELGFKEMTGPMVDTSFWVFDALFTPQDHPAREMHDTFFIESTKGNIPQEFSKIKEKVKQSHETGICNSLGWRYKWSEEEAKKLVLRTHTTSISARTLASLKEKDLPAKYFIIGKVLRNETIDWSHSFEFYQSEGIVVDKNVNFRHLLGYLKVFYEKMGFPKIKFVPSFFAYTEPSVEIHVFHPEKKVWFELGGAGIFRPEVTAPLLGKPIPVLAWGQGFDRIIMNAYAIKDLREMYSNDLKELRNKKVWVRA